jgi:enoyl-CoA hydratase
MEMVKVTDFDDGTTLIAIDRPKKKNAICAQTAVELQQAFEAFDRADSQRVAVLTGTGDDAFSAGADLTDVPELWRCIPTVGITTEKPVIAAVAGWCVGGALVAVMMADLLVAAENARFSYPEAKVGFTGGLISVLPTRIPHKIAMELILLCRTIDAKRAYEAGLANEVVPTGMQVERALAMARELAGFSPLVLKTLKRFVVQEVMPKGPSERMAHAKRQLDVVRESADAKEAATAFREKRAPHWTGR